MTLKPEEVKNKVAFPVGDPNIIKYLKGESFKTGGNDGWALVLIDRFPIGWGKIQNSRLKNKIISGWKYEPHFS